MSADPFVPDVKDAQSYNRYSYVRNNPIVYVDPTGHFFDFIGEIIGAIGGAISAIGNAIASAASWAWSKLGEAGRFLKRAGQYAWMIMKGMVSRPESLFLVAVGLLISIANPAVGVPLWAKGMAIAIAAQSVAAAAGIRGPVLSIIPAAGALAGGGFSATNIIRVASSVVPDLAIQAVGDASLKRELSVLSALAAFVTSAFLSSKEQGGSAEEVTRTKGGSRTSLDSEQTRQCADVAPMPNTAPNPYPEDYFYRWVSARYVLQCRKRDMGEHRERLPSMHV